LRKGSIIVDQNQTNLPAEPEFETACGGKIKDPSKYPSADYRGERIYFCTRACLRVFEQNPDAFMAGDVEHPLEED
jgi:YHS domain-containing protein